MNAYDVLTELGDKTVDEREFYRLAAQFRNEFLIPKNFQEQMAIHRNPIELKAQLLRQLYDRYRAIQERPEMRCPTLDRDGLSYVPAVLKEMRQRDKRLKSLFQIVETYCSLRQAELKVIAVHIAEFRAVDKLIERFQRETMREGQRKSKSYTFDDWLIAAFRLEKTNRGDYVANDSEKYLDLVGMEKMTYDELNKIQDAQQKTYDYLIESSLELNLRWLRRQTKDTLNIDEVLAYKLGEVNRYFADHRSVYQEVVLPKRHRGIKWGAKFLLPIHYQTFLKKSLLDVYNLPSSSYHMNINGQMTAFPTLEQRQWAVMEVQIRWFHVLQNYKNQLTYERMLEVRDFKELIESYGGGEQLMEEYMKGISFAPDTELFIKNRVGIYEEVLPIFQSGMSVRDERTGTEVPIQTGEYRRTGYAWVSNGYNATPEDLRRATFRNASLGATVPTESRYAIYNQVLLQLAAGGAIAFHLAFLREQLRRPVAKVPVRRVVEFWQGAAAEKALLFQALSEESFLEASQESRTNFLNNAPVVWKQDARSLFYLLNELKSKLYRRLPVQENLGPLVRQNFLDKNGNPFRNISQNMSGMYNANAKGKPRLAPLIDEILRKALKG